MSVEESCRTSRIRVIFVVDNMGFGGTELNAIRTAERLDLDRFDLRVVCLSMDGPLAARYRERGIPVEILPIRSLYGPAMMSAGWHLLRYLRRERADVVHAHDVYSNIFATIWARIAGVPVVIVSRRWWNSLPNAKLRWGNRLAFSFADAVLANSVRVAKSVCDEGVPTEKVWMVPNFADDHAFASLAEQEQARLRSDWGVPEHAVVLGCVARLHPVKDHLTLLRAFALLKERHQEVHLVLVGDGPARQAIEALIEELRLGDSVHLAGEVRTGDNHHRGIDISVLTSTSEGFPNSLIEAMAAGNPVVATAVGGVVDAVADGETGILVPPGDPGALANALSSLVVDQGRRQELGRAGKERAQRYFRASTVVAQVEEMYRSLRTDARRHPRERSGSSSAAAAPRVESGS